MPARALQATIRTPYAAGTPKHRSGALQVRRAAPTVLFAIPDRILRRMPIKVAWFRQSASRQRYQIGSICSVWSQSASSIPIPYLYTLLILLLFKRVAPLL